GSPRGPVSAGVWVTGCRRLRGVSRIRVVALYAIHLCVEQPAVHERRQHCKAGTSFHSGDHGSLLSYGLSGDCHVVAIILLTTCQSPLIPGTPRRSWTVPDS